MVRQAILAAIILLAPTLTAGWGTVDVSLEPEGGSQFASRIISLADVIYLNSSGQPAGYGKLWGRHVVGPNFVRSYSNWDGVYSGYENIYANPGCYTATIEARFLPWWPNAINDAMDIMTAPVCLYVGPPSPKPETLPGDQGPTSPIIVRLSEGRYELTGPEAPVWFDIDADGVLDHITWPAAGTDQAFLWLDRDGNGTVTDGSELFGTATRLTSGMLATNGFEALDEFDVNSDQRLDRDDPIWPSLRLWFDGDHNGHAAAREVRPVEGSGIVALETGYHWAGRRDKHGNFFRYQGTAQIEHHGATSPRVIYDVFFTLVR